MIGALDVGGHRIRVDEPRPWCVLAVEMVDEPRGNLLGELVAQLAQPDRTQRTTGVGHPGDDPVLAQVKGQRGLRAQQVPGAAVALFARQVGQHTPELGGELDGRRRLRLPLLLPAEAVEVELGVLLRSRPTGVAVAGIAVAGIGVVASGMRRR